ncbi:MAG: DUF2157 domain-containing protein [Opitutales bacterium]|nr:DUF2157 domain-containing protein [Opitutales bacterium]
MSSQLVSRDSKHLAWLYSQLPQWQEKGWLNPEASESIKAHYGPSGVDLRRVTSVILAALAALLIGAGVILLFAHNWNELSRPLRAFLSVLPLLCTYALAAYALHRVPDSLPLREGAAMGNICALGAAIALVGQTYNIPGDISSFLLTVCILGLPAVYLLRSVGAASLYAVGVCIWKLNEYDFVRSAGLYDATMFWLLLALLVPLVILLGKQGRNFAQRWLVAFMLGAFAIGLYVKGWDLWATLTGYACLFSAVVSFRSWSGGARYIAAFPFAAALAGLLVILSVASFHDFWKELDFFNSPVRAEAVSVLVILVLASVIPLVFVYRRRDWMGVLWGGLGPVILLLRLVTINAPDGAVGYFLANLMGIALGAATTYLGYRAERMGTVNFGMLTMSLMFLLRFFDEDLPMVFRGMAFIVIGVAFIVVNLRLGAKFRKERQA